jgi:hypothetical protein
MHRFKSDMYAGGISHCLISNRREVLPDVTRTDAAPSSLASCKELSRGTMSLCSQPFAIPAAAR